MEKTFKISSPAEFLEVIEEIFNPPAETEDGQSLVIALEGDLGAGKTTFVQELGKYLGVSQQVNSPTFTIMKSYELKNNPYENLVHIDAYRIEDENELGPLKIKDLISDQNNIVCIEWPEQIPSIIPEDAIKLQINILEGDIREVNLQKK